ALENRGAGNQQGVRVDQRVVVRGYGGVRADDAVGSHRHRHTAGNIGTHPGSIVGHDGVDKGGASNSAVEYSTAVHVSGISGNRAIGDGQGQRGEISNAAAVRTVRVIVEEGRVGNGIRAGDELQTAADEGCCITGDCATGHIQRADGEQHATATAAGSSVIEN